jgi:hypothetical protein
MSDGRCKCEEEGKCEIVKEAQILFKRDSMSDGRYQGEEEIRKESLYQ